MNNDCVKERRPPGPGRSHPIPKEAMVIGRTIYRIAFIGSAMIG